jgi:hypothetical protein
MDLNVNGDYGLESSMERIILVWEKSVDREVLTVLLNVI